MYNYAPRYYMHVHVCACMHTIQASTRNMSTYMYMYM